MGLADCCSDLAVTPLWPSQPDREVPHVTTDTSPSNAANVATDAWMFCTFLCCLWTALMSPPWSIYCLLSTQGGFRAASPSTVCISTLTVTCVARTVRQHCPAPTRNLSPCPSCDWETRSTSKCLCPTVLQSQSQCEITQHIGHMFGGGVLLLTCLHTAKQMRIRLCMTVNSMPQESLTGPLQRPSSPVGKLLENSDFSRLASRSV